MKTLRSTLAILILMLSLNMTIFAQDETAEPKPTEAPAEATVVVEAPAAEPVEVAEPAPTETVDVQNWLDDTLEFVEKNGLLFILAIGLIAQLFRMNKPVTSEEKQRTADEIARQLEQARQTATPYDDLIAEFRSVLNGLRRIEDTLPAVAAASGYPVSGATPDTIRTTTTTSIGNADSEPVG